MTALRIWLITDGRPGHRNQLLGLCQRLEALAEVESHWLDLSRQGFRYRGGAALRAQFASEGDPDWIIGAGRRSHWPLLWCKWRSGGKAAVIMKPSLPLALFDAAIIPRHDGVAGSERVLLSQGVINHIQPRRSGRDPRRGLILLGGINRHFAWDNALIASQVKAIVRAQPGVDWFLSDSPRSPDSLLPMLADLSQPNLQIVPHRQGGADWLPGQLAAAAQVWVSCDSVSMVYEAITSGAAVGLLEMPPLRDSRVCRNVEQLRAGDLLSSFSGADLASPLSAPETPLWEADRAARWLLARSGLAAANTLEAADER